MTQLLVLFDLDKLLSEIDLDMVEIDADGVVRINEKSNSDISIKIWLNIHHSCKAGEDSDDDDKIDDDDSEDD